MQRESDRRPFTRAILPDVCRRLPTYALPRVVLMPGALLPLHVSEARHRALVEHCLATHRVLAIATLVPGHEREYLQVPPIFPELGLGCIVSDRALADGKLDVVVQCVGRATFLEDLTDGQLFRLSRARLREDVRDGSENPLRLLRTLILQIGAVSPDSRDEAERLSLLGGGELVDELARKILEAPEAQRRYIATDRLADRAQIVLDILSEALNPGRSPKALA